MERCVPRFRWYRAFRVINLVAAIITLLAAVLFVVAMTFFRMAALHESPPQELVELLDAIKVLAYQSLAILSVTGLLFLATYISLKLRRKAAVYLAYAQNAWLPVSNLLMIPITTAYFRSLSDSMQPYASGSLGDGIAILSVMVNTAVPVSYVVGALILAAALAPNSIYFYKRREFIHLEDVSV